MKTKLLFACLVAWAGSTAQRCPQKETWFTKAESKDVRLAVRGGWVFVYNLQKVSALMLIVYPDTTITVLHMPAGDSMVLDTYPGCGLYSAKPIKDGNQPPAPAVFIKTACEAKTEYFD